MRQRLIARATRRRLSAGARLLHRRTWHRAVGTEHAAVSRFRLEAGAASLALIEELAGIGRHGFHARGPATRAGDDALDDHPRPRTLRRRRYSARPIRPRHAISAGMST